MSGPELYRTYGFVDDRPDPDVDPLPSLRSTLDVTYIQDPRRARASVIGEQLALRESFQRGGDRDRNQAETETETPY